MRLAPRSPGQALQAFRTLDGFRLELIAAEPLLADPVAVQYDEDGRAWVAEMGDYPYSDKSLDRPYEDQPSLPLGRIRILTDTNGDGVFDQSQIFADELSWPTGLAFWKGGIYVTSTPDILYLKDTDGDGRADIRRTVFTGFRKYNVQAVINNLQWGLDHSIYGAGSSNGGAIVPGDPSVKSGPVRLSRNDFRIDPAAESFEAIAGGARFGNTFDDWGNRFICNIRNPVEQVVLENRFLARNPNLLLRSGIQEVADSGTVAVYRASPPEPWRVLNAERNAANPDSSAPQSEKAATGYVTSASGVTVYRGAAYPGEYAGNAFVGEVSGNLIIRYELQPDGVTFRALHRHEQTDFVASTDNWFRPVNFVNAPDGTLHIVDMYRETIEHPWSIPDDIKAQVDLRSGSDRGRIYRLVPPRYREGFVAPPQPRLGAASTADLVRELENPNSWWRETAHRLIFERGDLSAVEPLRQLLRQSTFPLARLHALWSLHGLGGLRDDDLLAALGDVHPLVRVHALRVEESSKINSQRIDAAILQAASDPDLRVRFQAALNLARLGPAATGALAGILRKDPGDAWIQAAVLTSLGPGSPAEFALPLIRDPQFHSQPGAGSLIRQLAEMTGSSGDTAGVQDILQAAAEAIPEWSLQSEIFTGLGMGLKRKGLALRHVTKSIAGRRIIDHFLDEARRLALAADGPLESRLSAIARLGLEDFAQAAPVLVQLLDARLPQEVQIRAVETLSGYRETAVAQVLLDRYSRLTPPVRKAVVDALLARLDRTEPLLQAVQQGQVSASLISATRRTLLMQSTSPAVKTLALQLFSSDAPSPRAEVIAEYQPALQLAPSLSRGEAVFKRDCANCHRLGNLGHDVAPNLSTVRHRAPAELLVHILDPNREVSPSFLEYVVATEDGRVFNGMIASETANSITLRGPERKEQTILRSEISEMTDTRKSLMPEGLEKKLTPQDMADVLEFVLKSPLN